MSSTTAGALRRAPYGGAYEERSMLASSVLALLVAAAGLLIAVSLSLTTQADEGTAQPVTAAPAVADPSLVAQRSQALQSAILAEVAAQRGDALAKDAEDVQRASLSAAGSARQQRLIEEDRSAQAAAAAIAQQRLQIATAARQAAADAGVVDPTVSTPASDGMLPAGTVGVLPVPSGVVGAKFGEYGHWSRYHTGLDFRAAYGTPIHAVLTGTVIYVGNSGDWAGNHVAIRHADGRTTMYAHMSRTAATVGATVQTGDLIGYVGQTGRAFGAHLHFELYPPGIRYGDVYKAVDPMPWLRNIGVQTH